MADLEEDVERLSANHSDYQRRLALLEQGIAQVRLDLTSRFRSVERLTDHLPALEGLAADQPHADAAVLPPPPEAADTSLGVVASTSALDAYYLAFENSCRGHEVEIAAQLREDHLPTVQAAVARTDKGGVLAHLCRAP